jgi:hypothetical protein
VLVRAVPHDLLLFGQEYLARIRVSGALPSSLSDPAIFIEWDMLVDVDQDPTTRPWGSWPLIDNSIGVDLLIRLMLGPRGEAYRAQVRDLVKKTSQTIEFKIDGATIELRFSASSIGNPKAFDYVFAVRKFGNYGSAGAEVACDKAPNEGFFTISDSKSLITKKPSQPGQPTEKLQADHSIIFYNQGNERNARWYGEAFEFAYVQVGADLGAYPRKQFTLYIYVTQEDLVRGLQLYSGFFG